MYSTFYKLIMAVYILEISCDNINLDRSNNYSIRSTNGRGQNQVEKNIEIKIDVLANTFKKNINMLKMLAKLDIVFLIDASSSVGENNFKSELKFVKKILSDVTVDSNHTRVAIVTFSSPRNTIKNVDEISESSKEQTKCFLLNRQLNNIDYRGGETFTIGAFQIAKDIFDSASRNNSRKVLILITDGYSNGGDPIPLANELKNSKVTIFTIGVESGNYNELYGLSSSGESYSYLLNSFKEFDSLARKALHIDLKNGNYLSIDENRPCDILCPEGDCCDNKAQCTCGTTTGHYACICQKGYYGSGLRNSCLPCIPGTYSTGPNLCLPCPDAHHTTVWPAYGLESCICKEGYQTINGTECKVVKCPEISTPKHGYFVKKRECVNVFNSACGIRCEVGYTLVGSSIRLCQLNATWSGNESTCEVKTCPQLSIPKFGKIKCRHEDLDIEYNRSYKKLPVDTVCSFECEKGRFLVGSKKRTCLPLSTWDGLKTTCKGYRFPSDFFPVHTQLNCCSIADELTEAIKCNKLPEIKFGKTEPTSCSIGKQDIGKTCKIICNDGFIIKGTAGRRCIGGLDGWDNKFDDTFCIDITPPELKCPKNLTTYTLMGKKYGQVEWQRPFITDNSGLEVLLWIKPTLTNTSSFKFEIGETPLTYFAQDAFRNTAKCTFFVSVLDNEMPVIENCVNPPNFLTKDINGASITWEEPYIYDNSQALKVSRSHEFGYFNVGVTTVTYTATDSSGNTNICKLNITVEGISCESFPAPAFGQIKCNSQVDDIHCIVTCQEGYAIALAEENVEAVNTTSFICNSVFFNEALFFPECSVTSIPEESVQDGDISFTSESNICEDTKELEKLKNIVGSTLTNDICVENCTVDSEFECETERKEELFNRIVRRRSTVFEEVCHKNKNKKHKKKINVKFQIRGKYLNETRNELKNVIRRNGYSFTIRYNKRRYVCPLGFVRRKNRCVQCPKGTFQDNKTNKCQSCSFGYYNDKLGQTACFQCPSHYSTKKIHSKHANECKEECPPGTYAQKKYLKYSKYYPGVKIERTTLKPHCTLCAVGYYQSEYGQLKCKPCPSGYTTTGVGSTILKQCIPTASNICSSDVNICTNGTCVVINDYEYTCNCSKNYIGKNCEKLLNECMSEPCLNGGTCNYVNDTFVCTCKKGFTGKNCQEEFIKCDINCLNNGICTENDVNDLFCLCPTGYGGEQCEIKINYCSEYLCENNGTCIEEQNTFKCNCLSGFIGRRCNILPCDYKPCGEFTICVNTGKENATKKDYSCICPEGFTGKGCNIKLNHCQRVPCLNGGSCKSYLLNYSCACTKLYYGPNCEYKRDSKYLLHFQRYNLNDYIKLNGFDGNVTEITACLWIQSSDNFNYGTLISYATKYIDNAFTLTDYTGLVLYINNNYIVTDVVLNDGEWHHICITWQSKEGIYKVYLDGNVVKSGTDLSKGTFIQGDGIMIIGQEQDELGGGFSLSESFIGKICYIDVWSKILREEEIMMHLTDCNESFFGNLYAWPEMQNFVYGGVQILESLFCNKCEDPKPPFNGEVQVIQNIAYYSCPIGYELNIKKYMKGRKCTKAAKWEGFYEPYCKKISCGYPGFVKNAYQIGNSYYFQDKIKYSCYYEFKIVGNNTITCGKDGIWIPNKPHCLGYQCVAFKKPPNSEINIFSDYSYNEFVENITKVEVGTQVEVICRTDTDISGENIITCTENGTWDYELPQCKQRKQHGVRNILDCSIKQLPAAPNNGYIDLKSLYAAGNGTTHFVEYKCRPGYKLYGDNTTTCIVDGYWTHLNMSCRAITCMAPPLLKNMVLKEDLIKKTYFVGNMIPFQCEDGYSMFRNGIISCLPNGKWSKIQGKCIKKSCRKPNVGEGAVVHGKSFLFNDTVTIICANGSNYKITCNKYGVWEGEAC